MCMHRGNLIAQALRRNADETWYKILLDVYRPDFVYIVVGWMWRFHICVKI